jgi:hypothetical protein
MVHEWSPRWPESRISEIKKKLEKWMKAHRVLFDAHVYTREEWEKRGEKYGNTAIITIAAEGPFYEMMNDPNPYDVKTQEKFRAFIKQMGFFQEQGYSWTWHFYPEDDSDRRFIPKEGAGPTLGASGSERPSTLFSVLGEIAYFKPKLVLVKGHDYFRIEEMITAGRKLVHSDSPQAILIHRLHEFSWAEDSRNKIVIWQEGPRGRRPVYVEPGSEVVA